jgi:hypothetical protein
MLLVSGLDWFVDEHSVSFDFNLCRYDPDASEWSSAGCRTGPAPQTMPLFSTRVRPVTIFLSYFPLPGLLTSTEQTNVGSLECTCDHLTEFAIMYLQAQADQCSNNALYGSSLYLILVLAYGLLTVVDGLQVVRVIKFSGCAHFLLATEHCLVLVIALLRVLNNLLYWKFWADIDPSILTVVTGFPHYLTSTLFTFVIFAWASIYHSADSRHANPFKVGHQ